MGRQARLDSWAGCLEQSPLSQNWPGREAGADAPFLLGLVTKWVDRRTVRGGEKRRLPCVGHLTLHFRGMRDAKPSGEMLVSPAAEVPGFLGKCLLGSPPRILHSRMKHALSFRQTMHPAGDLQHQPRRFPSSVPRGQNYKVRIRPSFLEVRVYERGAVSGKRAPPTGVRTEWMPGNKNLTACFELLSENTRRELKPAVKYPPSCVP